MNINIDSFAEKYGFLQQKDIDMIERADFDIRNYRNLQNKSFVSINDFSTIMRFGKIDVLIDTIDEQEWYSIDTNIYFSINILDFKDEQTILETILIECKKHCLL
jgi:hypothetical protein